MKKCPFCSAEIEDDSFYCDQCGKELKVCLDCGAFARGKVCTQCRSKNIVLAKEWHNEKTEVNPQQSAPQPVRSQQVEQQPVFQQPPQGKPLGKIPLDQILEPEATQRQPSQAAAAPVPPVVRLEGNGYVMQLNQSVGQYILGRKVGDFVYVFGSDSYVSRQHACLQYNAGKGCWQIKDLGSSNGTSVNGTQLTPNVFCDLHIGDVVQIAFTNYKLTN